MLDNQAIIKYNNSILVSINNGMKMNKDQKLDHMVALMEEINIISQRIEPQDCGHLNTTVRVLSDRVTEIKQELKNDQEKSP